MAKNAKAKAKVDQQKLDQLILKVKEQFPEWAFFFDEDFGGYSQEVRDLLIEAALDPNYTEALFDRKYKQTAYYNEVDKDIRAWNASTAEARNTLIESTVDAIRGSYGDVFASDEDLMKVAEGAARQNLSGVRLKNYVFSQAAAMGKSTAAVTGSASADAIRKIATDYGYQASDDEIESILTGKPERGTTNVLTEQGLRERAKLAILGEMPHLKPQLDAGLTPATMFKNYQTEAATLLGVDPNTINFSDPKWRNALASRDPQGNIRQLSLPEWRREIRTNPEYGYQFTPQANQDALDIALTVAKAFGKSI
jgi:hypothetical protein